MHQSVPWPPDVGALSLGSIVNRCGLQNASFGDGFPEYDAGERGSRRPLRSFLEACPECIYQEQGSLTSSIRHPRFPVRFTLVTLLIGGRARGSTRLFLPGLCSTPSWARLHLRAKPWTLRVGHFLRSSVRQQPRR